MIKKTLISLAVLVTPLANANLFESHGTYVESLSEGKYLRMVTPIEPNDLGLTHFATGCYISHYDDFTGKKKALTESRFFYDINTFAFSETYQDRILFEKSNQGDRFNRMSVTVGYEDNKKGFAITHQSNYEISKYTGVTMGNAYNLLVDAEKVRLTAINYKGAEKGVSPSQVKDKKEGTAIFNARGIKPAFDYLKNACVKLEPLKV
ncbi:hypothetical protein OPW41_17075 [Vibrio europaeus]|uniref:Uncharacterized protein n=1 Tax=Vibrio europaeus TaxID=300876 RepID=A0A178JE09_9VIBR|nr:hypothetical protein [Vibrio europaeus]MDC5707621.1 hypothetical protein [Vibrio europaeus]MDC5709867.1 hypothetical protein [Vibrio europaeus]MDC5716656.1 hypothetical protein [Vibrio europaeus]MDC5722723.1 hypothetical protein [Vibrio europaeus]MDC5726976.1 hypothetical protein [Vibrio europaeus]